MYLRTLFCGLGTSENLRLPHVTNGFAQSMHSLTMLSGRRATVYGTVHLQIHNTPKMVSSAPPAKYPITDGLRCLLATPDILTPKGR